MHIRRAVESDAEILTKIAFESKQNWSYPEYWMEAMKKDLTIDKNFINENDVFLAESSNNAIGFYGITLSKNQCELEHLWVHPDFIKKKIGTILFKHAVDRIRNMGYESFEIISDPNAEEFYLKMGAKRNGEHRYTLLKNVRILPKLEYSTG